MRFEIVKSYLLVVVCGLVLFAAAVLVVLQWDMDAGFLFYGSPQQTKTIWVMLASAVGGVVLLRVARLFAGGVLALWRDRRRAARAAKEAEAALAKAAKAPPGDERRP